MVTLFITALAIILIVGIGLYFWQKSTQDNSDYVLPPRTDARGLFSDDQSNAEYEKEQRAIVAAQQAESLIGRAQNGERNALNEAHEGGDADLNRQTLRALDRLAESRPKLLPLMVYVIPHDRPLTSPQAT